MCRFSDCALNAAAYNTFLTCKHESIPIHDYIHRFLLDSTSEFILSNQHFSQTLRNSGENFSKKLLDSLLKIDLCLIHKLKIFHQIFYI